MLWALWASKTFSRLLKMPSSEKPKWCDTYSCKYWRKPKNFLKKAPCIWLQLKVILEYSDDVSFFLLLLSKTKLKNLFETNYIFLTCSKVYKHCFLYQQKDLHKITQKNSWIFLKDSIDWFQNYSLSMSKTSEKTLSIENTSWFWFKRVWNFLIWESMHFLFIFWYLQISFVVKSFGVDQV